jgi:FAD dependent oxidoreductase
MHQGPKAAQSDQQKAILAGVPGSAQVSVGPLAGRAQPAQDEAGCFAANNHTQSERPAMNASDELTRSLWMDVSVADAPQLCDQLQVDTVIVGSGIAGLSTAYELAFEGQRVVVLDRGRIAGE